MTDGRILEESYVVRAYRRFDAVLATAFEHSIVAVLIRTLVDPIDERIANTVAYLQWLLSRSTVHALFFGVPSGTIKLSFTVPNHFAECIQRLQAAFASSRVVRLFTHDHE